MRAKYLFLAVLIAAVFAAGFYFGNTRQESQAVPEKVIYYTTTSPGAEEEKEGASDEVLTEAQKEAFKEAGFKTDRFHGISTEPKGGTK